MPYYGKRRRGKKPFLRRTRRKYGTRGYGRRRGGRMMRRTVSITPNVKYVKFEYATTVIFTTAAGLAYVVAMNDMSDPDSTGKQPTGFDQWMAFYERFEVMSSAIDVTAYCEGDTTGAVVSVYPSIESSPVTVIATKIQPFGQYKNMCGGATGNQYARIKKYMKIRYFEGRSTADPDYTGTVALAPDFERYWITTVFAFNLMDTITVNCDIKITYYARLFRRKSLADVVPTLVPSLVSVPAPLVALPVDNPILDALDGV